MKGVDMLFIMEYWYLWVIGLILMPVIAVLPQLKNILETMNRQDKNPKEIVKLFLNPGTLVISIIGCVGAFICLVFFFMSIIFALIKYIKS